MPPLSRSRAGSAAMLGLGLCVPLAPLSAQAATLTTIGTVTGTKDGYLLTPALATGSTGKVFVSTASGPSSVGGYVLSLTKPSSGTAWTRANLASFPGGSNGAYPAARGMLDSKGVYYGSTEGGGVTASPCTLAGYAGCGVIYALTPPKTGSIWARSILYSFKGGSDGQTPLGALVADAAGNLYGVTANGGGASACNAGCGTVFRLSPPVSGTTAWKLTVLHGFAGGADGATPNPGLVIGSDGTLYGTTRAGGVAVSAKSGTLTTYPCQTAYGNNNASTGCGTIFALKPPAAGSTVWTNAVLYSFLNGADGASPQSGLAIDTAGNLYGAAIQGGDTSLSCKQVGLSGCGVVFELVTPASGAWTLRTLYGFPASGTAEGPVGVIRDRNGVLYGTAAFTPAPGSACAGASAFYCGAVFTLTPQNSGASYSYAQIYTFKNSGDGAYPLARLSADTAGVLYGVTGYGSTNTVFALTGTGFAP